MRILHTESSSGWGGQEIRILREAIGMRSRGHEVIFAVQKGGKLIAKARAEGFKVYEIAFKRSHALAAVFAILRICKRHTIDLVNTHSSLDAWLGGIAARICGCKVLRTRHLSTPIRKGLNSLLLYNKLADFVATTSSCIVPLIIEQASQDPNCVRCIPTGLDPKSIQVDPDKSREFRSSLGVSESDVLVGTVCIVRSWKGIVDLLQAALLLKDHTHIKWVIIGGGYLDQYEPKVKEWGLEKTVTFTGHLEDPFSAMAALDIFALLSTAHEGISQASLQAAYLEKPLITTPIGGLPEVCLHEKTGLIVPTFSSQAVSEAVLQLAADRNKRLSWGRAAKELVEEKFLFNKTLDEMERVYLAK